MGTPQGDSLSPVLFIMCLESALKDIKSAQNNSQQSAHCMHSEIIYADDIDFIGTESISVGDIETSLKTHNLKVNVYKTEHTCRTEMNGGQKDLDLIRDIAENRDEWRTFIAEIRRGTAEAVRSDDPTSERL
ncbi:hypothetical protein ElyMa_002228700 [Elysia marginata]|uniref:Reverse transcriptase domain-containing protein n=1 Tax=Elysia marginata TaxID=1093978 RepID=A0AAV4FUX4_9GAST|nr:hypothetical protein ElyMa_002228700 [Elysia marginata]